MNLDLIYNWLESFGYTENQIRYLQEPRVEKPDCNLNYHKIASENLLKLIPYNSFKNPLLSVDTRATLLIQKLFNKYVDDDTLVITTGSEHGSVRQELSKCKNVIAPICRGVLRQDVDLELECKHFKKAFIYMIALSVGDDHYLYNCDVKHIQEILRNNNVEFVTVLDAVQECFLLPRDFSIYDFVIGTAHALIPEYNMGMLFGTDKMSCDYAGNWISDFTNKLKMLFENKSLLYMFNNVMSQTLSDVTRSDNSLRDTSRASFFYNLADYKKRFDGLNEIEVENGSVAPTDYTPVTFRALPFLLQQKKFFDKLKTIDFILRSG